MDVKCLGFSVTVDNSAVGLNELFSFFENEGCIIDDEHLNQRRFYIDSVHNNNYYTGLVVTVKDQKKFCRLSDKNGNITIKVENLKGSEKLLEFNFFIVDKITGLGLYQHYHQSCSLNVFGQYLKKYHKILRNTKSESEISILEHKKGRSLNEAQRAKIRSKYRAKLTFAPLVRQEKLEEILNEFKKIKSFEFEYQYLTNDIRKATPLSKYVKRKREKLTFVSGSGVNVLANAISSFVDSEEAKSGRVFVEDYDGETFPLKIYNMPDCFGVEDFDALATKLNGLEVDRFHEHKYIKELISIIESEDYEHIFGMEIEE
ncbi:P-loop NTPase family protein [Shewanella sedimentimangrovi]|uniref:Uncharacterized protein n=1 Tax=Shewanella sedimentimangrovi TaxID=2814293 RepID=A0ABX7R1E3_9GAMM|nr:hypothetical protein [Shewanella sedimentimangrovi]QSX37621.1 hypothetical protein JYB85_01935 [Shewanella sedimentimangrovi]